MANSKETINAELLVAVKEAVEAMTGVEFGLFFAVYQEKNADQPELTHEDLAAEILEAGNYQNEVDASFEDVVMIGALAMGEDLVIFLASDSSNA